MSRQIYGTASKLVICLSQRPRLTTKNALCPVARFRNHCNVNGKKPFEIGLFVSSTKNRSWRFVCNAGHTQLTSAPDIFRRQNSQGTVRPNLMFNRGLSTKPRSESGSDVSVQGVQGDDCTAFLTWIGRCRRYGLENCQEQLEAIRTGKKTLGQVLAEQEELIVEIAKKYKEEMEEHHVDENGDHIKQLDYDDYDFQSPCPQGIQGDDCTQFKLWLEKCHQFGFMTCIERLNRTRIGDKSLEEIFADHDLLIRKLVRQHRQK
ncbi:uncharacterized protein LOC121388492 [Gigantopelta aegis]|uniref:uncharacterized protein LOC121388492 n=1 Tax=Gigantopelta aegis TaxID=1735272 RepID=UPI001B887D2B|nr:uncharacterized protein LOC121388492 [Gigantopelta aegis]